MIPLKRIPLLAAILLTFSATGFAQKFCTVAPPSPYKHDARIVTTYDRSVDKMKTTLEHPRELGGGIHLYASFFYQDRRLRTLPTIDIFFISAAKQPKYRDAHDISIYADGVQWPYAGQAQYYTESGPKGLTIEKIKLTLPYASLASLLKSQRITAHLGATTFELSFNHLESLREIASLMAPPAANVARR